MEINYPEKNFPVNIDRKKTRIFKTSALITAENQNTPHDQLGLHEGIMLNEFLSDRANFGKDHQNLFLQ